MKLNLQLFAVVTTTGIKKPKPYTVNPDGIVKTDKTTTNSAEAKPEKTTNTSTTSTNTSTNTSTSGASKTSSA